MSIQHLVPSTQRPSSVYNFYTHSMASPRALGLDAAVAAFLTWASRVFIVVHHVISRSSPTSSKFVQCAASNTWAPSKNCSCPYSSVEREVHTYWPELKEVLQVPQYSRHRKFPFHSISSSDQCVQILQTTTIGQASTGRTSLRVHAVERSIFAIVVVLAPRQTRSVPDGHCDIVLLFTQLSAGPHAGKVGADIRLL
jgi:hypothetical protein